MKKLLIILLSLVLSLSLFSCTQDVSVSEISVDEAISMANIDDYIGRDDIQFVDLRNFDDKFNAGYISGFEIIPFFQYLEGKALTRNNGWEFSESDITNKNLLTNFFDEDKAIVLMCGSGTRAGYVEAALESIGYEKVYNAGGYKDYNGTNKVLGDNEFKLFPAKLTGEETIDMTNIDKYIGRNDVQFVDLRNFEDKFKAGYISGFEIIPFFQYLDNNALTRNNGWEFTESDITSEVILKNFFNKDKAIILMCGSGTRAGYVKAALESIGYEKVYNAGGYKDYNGTNKVLGDNVYELSK